MLLTPIQTAVMIVAVALGAIATRFIPFLLFPEDKRPPRVVTYLGQVLPPAMIGLLVVYCLKDVQWLAAPHGIPQMLGVAVTVVVHLLKNNALLSIGSGTAVTMLLVQTVFA